MSFLLVFGKIRSHLLSPRLHQHKNTIGIIWVFVWNNVWKQAAGRAQLMWGIMTYLLSQLSINVIRQSHVMGGQTTRPSTAEYQKPAKGVSSLLFSSFVHTLLPSFSGKISFSMLFRGVPCNKRGGFNICKFYIHPQKRHWTRYKVWMFEKLAWIFGTLVYWCTALLVQKRNPI